MHPQDSIFTGVKIIDYRNGRYQGLFNSSTEKRQGMGILIDDDMNIYCSEWEDNRMSGSTFIYFANGNYIYGMWKSNQPHGVNIYRNKEFILVGVYHRGSNVGSTLAITDPINHMLVFAGDQISLKEQKRKDLELISSENIVEINYFEDIIYHTAGKNAIHLSKREISLINFLNGFADKYHQYIKLDNKNKEYYFGFVNGLGFRFNLNGKVNHRINLISIGTHEQGQRVSDFGKKYHESRCIQQGNFSLKQTITYNRSSERPRDKCIAIYQKNHKKALNFINQYYQYRANLIVNLQLFLIHQLFPKHQEHLKRQFQIRRTSKPEANPVKQDDIDNRLSILRKMSAKNDKKRGEIENRNLTKHAQNRSTSALYKKQSTKNLSNNYKHKDKHNESQEYNQYQQIQAQINHTFKKEIICERCKSKQVKRSRDKMGTAKKQSPQKLRSRSKSGNKGAKNSKQLKYLVNYKKPQNLKQKLLAKEQRSHSKSFTNLLKKGQKESQKQRIRVQNQIKIREQLFNQQIQREVQNHYRARQYPLTISQLLVQANQRPHSSSIIELNPSSRGSNLIPNTIIKHHPDDDVNMDSNKKIDFLQNRRNKILREFKQLNTYISNTHQKSPKQQSYRKMEQIKVSPFNNNEMHRHRQGLDERDRVLQFNKRYRNYLQAETINRQNQFYKRYDPLIRSPYVPSFIYTPPRNQFKLNQQKAKKSKQKKYQYFFNSPPH